MIRTNNLSSSIFYMMHNVLGLTSKDGIFHLLTGAVWRPGRSSSSVG